MRSGNSGLVCEVASSAFGRCGIVASQRSVAAMKFGICNEIFQGWTLDDTFAFAKKAGYDFVEIAPFTVAKYVTEISATERLRIRDGAARAGIGISGLHWVLVQAEGMYLNHPDTGVRERTAKYFCELVKFCADLGGKISFSQRKSAGISLQKLAANPIITTPSHTTNEIAIRTQAGADPSFRSACSWPLIDRGTTSLRGMGRHLPFAVGTS